MDILDILETNANQYPGKLAYGYIGKEGEVTEQLHYAALYEQVCSFSQTLRKLSGPNSRAIILLPAEASFIQFFLALLQAEIIAVPCPIGFSEPAINRILNIVRDCEASIMITNRKTHKMFFQRRTPASAALLDYRIKWFFTDDITFEKPVRNVRNRESADTKPAYLQYTSGSTSTPKGVMVSHKNLTANLSAINHCFGRTANDTSVTWLPHYHDMGLVDGLLSPLFTGGTGYVISPLLFITKPFLLLQTISTYRAGFCGGPGFGLDHCVARITDEQRIGLDLSPLKVLYVGAEPIRVSSLENFAETMRPAGFKRNSLVPAYGLAEATLAVSLHLPGTALIFEKLNENNAKQVVACGPPVEFTQVAIVDPDSKDLLADTETGEIWVKNEGVALGYWNNPEATRETFQAYTTSGDGPYLRTGDLGFMKDGKLFITGRRKELIIIRGVNYYPQDIEEVISACHEDIQPNGTAAFSMETEQGEALMIVTEVKRSVQAEETEHIKTRVAHSVGLAFGLIPHQVILISSGKLPKTSSGKIQRLKAREIFSNNIVR